MKWKNRLTNYNFWISIVSAVLLICQALNLEFDIAYINEIVTAVLGLLVVIGIISDPTKTGKDSSSTTTNVEKENNETIKNVVIDNKTTNLVKEDTTEQAVPTNQENEASFSVNQNDLQVLIDKIKQDLNAGLDLKTSSVKDEEFSSIDKIDHIDADVKTENALIGDNSNELEIDNEKIVELDNQVQSNDATDIEMVSNLDVIEEVETMQENTQDLEQNSNISESDITKPEETESEVLLKEQIKETENKIICYNIVN